MLDHYLKSYCDQQIADMLKYDFPLYFDSELCSTENNHNSALTDIKHVRQYVQDDLQYEAIIGPFDKIPCRLHTSPLMTRAKQDSNNNRTIMDLSWLKTF